MTDIDDRNFVFTLYYYFGGGGALKARAKKFTDDMLFAASRAISESAPEGELVPSPLDPNVHEAVAMAVSQAAGGKI